MKLVKDWRNAPKWFSMWCLTMAGAVNGAWAAIPPDLQSSIPDDYVTYGTIALMVLGAVGRLVDQNA